MTSFLNILFCEIRPQDSHSISFYNLQFYATEHFLIVDLKGELIHVNRRFYRVHLNIPHTSGTLGNRCLVSHLRQVLVKLDLHLVKENYKLIVSLSEDYVLRHSPLKD